MTESEEPTADEPEVTADEPIPTFDGAGTEDGVSQGYSSAPPSGLPPPPPVSTADEPEVTADEPISAFGGTATEHSVSQGFPSAPPSVLPPPPSGWKADPAPTAQLSGSFEGRESRTGNPLQRWWRNSSWFNRSLGIVTPLLIVVVLVLLGALASTANELDETEAALDESNQRVDGLEQDVESLQDQAASDLAAAEADGDARVQEVRDDVRERLDRIAERDADLDQRSRDLDQQADALRELTAAVEAASFSDGLYQVGTDIQPGTYRTDGGIGCYWARLNSSNTSDYIDNQFGDGPQTVEISGGWFESSGCGTWRRG